MFFYKSNKDTEKITWKPIFSTRIPPTLHVAPSENRYLSRIYDKHRSIKSNHAASKEQWTTGSGAFIARVDQRVAV